MRRILSLIACLACVPAWAQVPDDLPGGSVEGDLDGHKVVLPHLRTDMTAWITGDLATVQLVQTFENPHSKPMHARYIFPLPPDAAVHAMKLVVGERVLEAEIQESEKARATFETAAREGKQAALLTQHRPNVFTQEIANLMPGKAIQVRLEYVHVVPKRDGDYQFHFPMVVGPRYLPSAKVADGAPAPLVLGQWNLPASPPVATGKSIDPARVGLTLHLDGGAPLQWVDSRSHAIDVATVDDRRRTVRLAEGRTIDNQDFELSYRLATAEPAAATVTFREGETGVVGLLIEPPAKAEPAAVTPRELVFVLDCSGSMSGAPLDASKRFVHRMLDGLRDRDVFRVVRFSSASSEMTDGPIAATPENVKRAHAYLDSLQSEGGTEMTAGIRAALDPAVPKGALRLVVFLTDGYIGNDVEVTRLIHDRLGASRLFSLGIGNGVNRYLLEEMARAGRGVARIVRPDEDVEHTVDQLVKRLDAPYLTDLRVDWGDASVSDLTPAALPDLFLGQSVRVLARYARPGRHRVTVHGLVAGQPVALPLEVELPETAPEARALPIVWARGQVEDRMHAYVHPASDESGREALRKEVVALGLRHKLVTAWTSFVAVDHAPVNPGGQADAADVAVPQVEGVTRAAYPEGAFVGHAAPEPATWAALLLLLAMAAAWFRRRSDVA